VSYIIVLIKMRCGALKTVSIYVTGGVVSFQSWGTMPPPYEILYKGGEISSHE